VPAKMENVILKLTNAVKVDVNNNITVQLDKISLQLSSQAPSSGPTFQPTSQPSSVPTSYPTFVPTPYPVWNPAPYPVSNPIAYPVPQISSCFAGSETVQLERGDTISMSDVVLGDRILSADDTGALSFSDVIHIPHAKNDAVIPFLKISTEGNRSLTLTSSHLLWTQVCDKSSPMVLSQAVDTKIGVCLHTVLGLEKVSSIVKVFKKGFYTLITQNEFIVVNGIIASPFEKEQRLLYKRLFFYTIRQKLVQLFPKSMCGPWIENLENMFKIRYIRYIH